MLGRFFRRKQVPEEIIARDLRRALEQALASTTAAVSISGRGVNWHCSVEQSDSRCRIDCFHYPNHGVQYYTSFRRSAAEWATSRAQGHTLNQILFHRGSSYAIPSTVLEVRNTKMMFLRVVSTL